MDHEQRVTSVAVAERPSVEAVIAAVAQRREPAVLDSADVGAGRGRYTIVAFDPVETACWEEGEHDDPFLGMRARLADTLVSAPQSSGAGDPARFLGWIGYFAYEAGRFVERLPGRTSADLHLPIARFARYDAAAVHDANTGGWTMVASSDRLAAQWKAILGGARAVRIGSPPPPAPAVHNMTHGQYLQKVARAREYIAAGDIFQVNIARRETFPLGEPAWQTYLRLRSVNPAAYAAYLTLDDDKAILSASPELFLQLRGREVVSRPIKGTRPRGRDAQTDAAQRAELAGSAKDRAELAMIVDLVRNDLGRVCDYGSVKVIAPEGSPATPYELETHPTVHHLVATVAGRLANGRDAIDLVRACFPGGSITGAPKVRAMEIIDELEPTQRSVYTGAIGMFGLDGSMTLNIAIRTMIAAEGQVYVHAGGGIVADSRPEDEYAETQAKAAGMCRAIGTNSTEWRVLSTE